MRYRAFVHNAMGCVSFETQENGNNMLRAGVISVGTARPGAIDEWNKRAGGQ
jgi:hypothetical protein